MRQIYICTVLAAYDIISNKHCVVKMLPKSEKANNQEARAIEILKCGMDNNIPLVKYKLLKLTLDESHSSTGHRPGVYDLLISPRYIESLAKLTPVLHHRALVSSLKRMIQALEFIQSCNLVHMDVKVSL